MNTLFWSKSTNFGDALSPVMFEFLSKQKPVYASSNSSPKFVAIGSILNHAVTGDTVWGSGVAWLADKINTGITITATRGPITRSLCEEAGNICSDVYGDPAMLLPQIYNPSKEKRYKLGIIPHVIDYDLIQIPDSYNSDVIKIDLNSSIEGIVEQITSCENIISSSLHGIIAADAYNIPNGWCKISNRIIGDDTKFYDHFAAVKRGYMSPILLNNSTTHRLSFDDIVSYVQDCDTSKYTESDCTRLLKACPFYNP